MNHPRPSLSSSEEASLRESLKRCSPETVEAALQFRQSKNAALANTIVLGVVARFLEPEQRPKLQGECDRLRLMEDLGVDSLTMVEVVMLVEEVLQVSIKNEALRNLRTLGDVKAYVNAIARGEPPPESPVRLDISGIFTAMPQQPPFLFLQEAELSLSEGRGTYAISGQEPFLEGHFKDRPVFPASLQLEALGQLGVLFLLKGTHPDITGAVDSASVYFTGADGIRCSRVCQPGDTLALTVRPKRIKHPVAVFEGTITVNGEKAAFAEEISLAFTYLPAGDSPAPLSPPDAPAATLPR